LTKTTLKEEEMNDFWKTFKTVSLIYLGVIATGIVACIIYVLLPIAWQESIGMQVRSIAVFLESVHWQAYMVKIHIVSFYILKIMLSVYLGVFLFVLCLIFSGLLCINIQKLYNGHVERVRNKKLRAAVAFASVLASYLIVTCQPVSSVIDSVARFAHHF
jgi:hypothetical protein